MDLKYVQLQNIVLTGCPRSGKTTVMEALKESIAPGLTDVCFSFVKESATQLLRKDADMPRKDPIYFQTRVALTEYINEDGGLISLLGRPEPIKIQICDRGLCDLFVYLEAEQSSYISEMTPEYFLKRYSHVLYFSPYYADEITEGNEFRYETEDEILLRERKGRDVWFRHKSCTEIPSFDDVNERIAYTAKVLNGLIGCDIFLIKDKYI